MKVLGILVLIVIGLAAMGGMGDDSDDSTPAAAAAEVDSYATEAGRLAEKGEDISHEIESLAKKGLRLVAQGDAAGACAVVDSQIFKVNQLGKIVDRMSAAGVDADTIARIEEAETELRQHIGESEAACNSIGA